MQINLAIAFLEEGVGRQRAERDVDLPAVPRVGESVWVGSKFALRVKSVTWLWQGSSVPHVFFEAFDDSGAGIEMVDGLTVKLSSNLVQDLRASGWAIKSQ